MTVLLPSFIFALIFAINPAKTFFSVFSAAVVDSVTASVEVSSVVSVSVSETSLELSSEEISELDSSAFSTTVTLYVAVQPFDFAVIVAVPKATPFTVPFEDTVAIFVSEDDQVTP